MGSSASNFQEEQTDCKKEEKEASEAPAALSVGAKRNRPIILEDSEDEHDAETTSNPSGSSSSGHKKIKKIATTGAKASAEVGPAHGDGNSERNGRQAGDRELEKALRRIKTLEAIVREQGVEITELKLRLADGMGSSG